MRTSNCVVCTPTRQNRNKWNNRKNRIVYRFVMIRKIQFMERGGVAILIYALDKVWTQFFGPKLINSKAMRCSYGDQLNAPAGLKNDRMSPFPGHKKVTLWHLGILSGERRKFHFTESGPLCVQLLKPKYTPYNLICIFTNICSVQFKAITLRTVKIQLIFTFFHF